VIPVISYPVYTLAPVYTLCMSLSYHMAVIKTQGSRVMAIHDEVWGTIFRLRGILQWTHSTVRERSMRQGGTFMKATTEHRLS